METVEGYTTYNLSVSGVYKFNNGRRLFVSAEALNLNNKEYTLAMSSIPEVGRHYVIKAGIDF